jgi:hypothetical protein
MKTKKTIEYRLINGNESFTNIDEITSNDDFVISITIKSKRDNDFKDIKRHSMRLIMTFFFGLTLFINKSIGQTVNEPVENIYITELVPKRTVYLNKGTATMTGGVTREVIPISLPPNTVEWGYVISTYRKKEDLNNANNNGSIVSMIANAYDKTGLISSAISTTFPISTESFCDVKLMDAKNMQIFENKKDLIGISLNCYREGSSENFVGGKFIIKNFSSGTWYVGLRNPSTSLPVGVTFEAYAFVRKKSLQELQQDQSKLKKEENNQQLVNSINDLVNSFTVKKEEVIEDWNVERKNAIFYYILNYLIGKNNESSQNVSNCTMQNITSYFTYGQFNSITESERKQIINEQLNTCLRTEKKLSDEIDQKKQFNEKIVSLKIIDDNKQIAETYKKILLLGFTNNDQIFNTIGWYYLLAKDFEQARYYLKKGESQNPTDLYIQMNLAHLLLMQNKYEEAETLYVKYKNEKINGQKFKEIVKADYQTFDRFGILPEDASKIKKKIGI